MKPHTLQKLVAAAIIAVSLIVTVAIQAHAEEIKADPPPDLKAENEKLTNSNAELVRSIQIVQTQRNQCAQQLLDTQAQVQLLSERVASLEKLNGVLTKNLADATKKPEPPKEAAKR